MVDGHRVIVAWKGINAPVQNVDGGESIFACKGLTRSWKQQRNLVEFSAVMVFDMLNEHINQWVRIGRGRGSSD